MLDLGTSHPDYTYSNDLAQAKLTLALSLAAALVFVLMILAVVV